MKQEKLLKYENGKLKNQLIFSIPASKEVCGRECPGCYAMKFQRLYSSVLPYRERMYQASLQNDFESRIINEVTTCKKPLVAVRIHESGEFYSQNYIDKWTNIAKTIPQVTFYAFTKRMKDFDFTSLMNLPNVVIIDSLMHGKLNYDKLSNLDPTIFICPATQDKTVSCGIQCNYCMTKKAQQYGVNFIKH